MSRLCSVFADTVIFKINDYAQKFNNIILYPISDGSIPCCIISYTAIIRPGLRVRQLYSTW